MEELYVKAVDIIQVLIGNTLVVTDEVVDDAVNNAMKMFPELDKSVLKKRVLSLYGVRVSDFLLLEGKERRQPWLAEYKIQNEKNAKTWRFWTRYKKFLSHQKGYPPHVIKRLDEITDKVLDSLFDPRIDNVIIDKKGLVVGQVQSGKTANYTGLICKAADVGFNFIIILAGIHNNLRSQTQSRIDEGFLGFDTQYERSYNQTSTTKVGVGKIPGFDDAIASSYTTSAESGDFTKKATNTAGFNFNTPQPIILVVKKNVSVLKRLNTWLEAQTVKGEKITSKSLLLIDDEADNASINTNSGKGNKDGKKTKEQKELDPTAINRNIREILSKFNRTAYVGYTATPFANIFIAQDNTDLFPRDFIINLPAPTNYIGPEKVFGTSTDINSDDVLPIVVPINDYKEFVQEGHKKDDKTPTSADVPDSLKMAVKSFILTCAIRRARGQEKQHNSMLVHVSRFQRWQNDIRDVVKDLFEYYKSEIEANDSSIMREFRDLLEGNPKDQLSYKQVTETILQSPTLSKIDDSIRVHSWDEIQPLLYAAVQKIEIKSINGSTSDVVDYQRSINSGISVIAIGGDKLSRGLTLEGLSVSYFLRASKMYDTLMQMGRWFGYRPGYIDLCRLYTSNELNEWYRHIAIASAELQDEFEYLAESKSTPDMYALKVRTHPGRLQITAVNKMRNTRKIQVSWAGRLIETYQLPMDSGLKQKNLVATDNFLSGIGTPETVRGNFLWRNVSPESVCEYLEEFNVAENLKKVNLDLIAQYIREAVQSDELTEWSVVLMTKGNTPSTKDKAYEFCGKYKVNCFYRNRAEDTDYNTYFIRKNHIVGNPSDELIDLDDALLREALEETKRLCKTKNEEWNRPYPQPLIVRAKFRPKTQPILIIYPLNPEGSQVKIKGVHVPGTITYTAKDDPFVGFAIAFPHTDTNCAVSYQVNMVAEYADIEDNFDEENDND